VKNNCRCQVARLAQVILRKPLALKTEQSPAFSRTFCGSLCFFVAILFAFRPENSWKFVEIRAIRGLGVIATFLSTWLCTIQ
jgi:hypothetical protein